MRRVVLVMLVGCWRSSAPPSEPPTPKPSRFTGLSEPPRRRATPPDTSGVVPGPVSFLSIGPLTTGHAPWDNSSACSVCHSSTRPDVPAGKCVACHASIAMRISANRGLHGDPKLAGKACESCHREHKGRGYDPMGWKAFSGGKNGFDHAITGWPIAPKYAELRCTVCHVTVDRQGLQLYTDSDRALFL